MAKILRSKQAPEGQPLSAAFGPMRFDAGDAEYYETDDMVLLEAADAHPFFQVDYSGDGGPSPSDARAEARAAQAERKQRDRDKRHDAEKDPLDPNHLAARETESEKAEAAAHDDTDKSKEGNG